jgi:hypothetical protein
MLNKPLLISLMALAATATATSASHLGTMRLRGGADFKDKATGILFPETIKSAGSTLKVSFCDEYLAPGYSGRWGKKKPVFGVL